MADSPFTLDQIKDMIRKNPNLVFASIPPLAIALDGGKFVTVTVRGREIGLPLWTGAEWQWYADVATDLARRLQPSTFTRVVDQILPALEDTANTKALKRAAATLRALRDPMAKLAHEVVLEGMAGVFYEAAIELVIAAVAEHGNQHAGEILVDSFKDAGADWLRSIPAKIQAVFHMQTGQIASLVHGAGRAGNEILKKVFGIGAGGIVLIAVGLGILWAWNRYDSRHAAER